MKILQPRSQIQLSSTLVSRSETRQRFTLVSRSETRQKFTLVSRSETRQRFALVSRSETRLWWIALALCLTTFQSPLAAQSAILHTPSAIYSEVQLLKLTSATAWSFHLEGRETPVEAARIVRWGSWPGALDEQAVWLNDGSWLCGDVRLTGQNVTVASDWLEIPPLAWRDVRGLVLAPPTTRSRWLELQTQMQAAAGELDLLWLNGGKKLSGVIRTSSSQAETSSATFELDTSGQRLQLAWDEIEAIVFSPTLQGAMPSHVNTLQVGLVDGSLLWTTRVAPEQARVKIGLAGAIQLSSLDGPREFCQAVSYLAHQPAAPSAIEIGGTAPRADAVTEANGVATPVQFLSDLPVASYRHVSDSSLSWELGIDRDVYGRALHTQAGIFGRGLATHSTSQVAFRWDGSPGRLLAEVRLASPPPQATANLGSVTCQILLARNDKLQAVEQFSLRRSTFANRDDLQLLNVDLTDAKLVVLVTDKADFGQYGDHLLWLDARIAQP